MQCSEKTRLQKVRLSYRQKVLIQPAMAFLQLGASYYLADYLRPYMMPLTAISLVAVAIVGLQVLKEAAGG